MKIGCQSGYFMKQYGMGKGIALLGEAGFDAVDFSFNAWPYDHSMFTLGDAEFVRTFRSLSAQIKESGVAVAQAHAVVPSYRRDSEIDARIFDTIIKNIEATAMLDCPYIVIHPKIPSEYKYDFYRSETRELNLEFYSSLIPHLERTGVICLIENMFNWDDQKGKICPTVCSYAAELIDYMDMLDNPHFAICLDIGHANLTLDPPVQMIKALGSRIKALHIHDNNGVSDQHLCPYLGNIDWDAVTQALTFIGYNGVFSLETEKTFWYNRFHSIDLLNTAKQMARVAAELAQKVSAQ